MLASKKEVARLVKQLKKSDASDREIAVAKLSGLRGSAVVEHLGSALLDSSISVRRRAAQALAKKAADVRLAAAGREKTFSFLGKAAADESPLVARVAIDALDRRGGEEVVPHLFGALNSHDYEIRVLATGALMRIAAKLKGSEVSSPHAKALLRVYSAAPSSAHSDTISRALTDALAGNLKGDVREHFDAVHRRRVEEHGNRVPLRRRSY